MYLLLRTPSSFQTSVYIIYIIYTIHIINKPYKRTRNKSSLPLPRLWKLNL